MEPSVRKYRVLALVMLITGCHFKCAAASKVPPDFVPDGSVSSTDCDGGMQESASSVCTIQDSTSNLPTGVAAAAAAYMKGFVYVAGGAPNMNGPATNAVNFAPILDGGSIGTFTPTSSLPDTQGLVAGGLAAGDGFLYYVGGAHDPMAGFAPVDTTFFASVSSGGAIPSWTTGPPLPTAQVNLGVALTSNGFLYAIGGDSTDPEGDGGLSKTPSSSVFVSQIQTDGSIGPWSTTTALPGERDKLAVATNGRFIYVVGGAGFNSPGCNAGEVLLGESSNNGTIANWQEVTPYVESTLAGGAAVVENTLVVVMGRNLDLQPNGDPDILAAPLKSDGTIGNDWLKVGEFATNPFTYSRAVAASPTAVFSFGGTDGTSGNSLNGAEKIELSDGGVVCP